MCPTQADIVGLGKPEVAAALTVPFNGRDMEFRDVIYTLIKNGRQYRTRVYEWGEPASPVWMPANGSFDSYAAAILDELRTCEEC